MVDRWYFMIGDKQYGPVSSATLRQNAVGGRIPPHTLIRQAEGVAWIEAGQFFGHSKPATPAPPPLPAATQESPLDFLESTSTTPSVASDQLNRCSAATRSSVRRKQTDSTPYIVAGLVVAVVVLIGVVLFATGTIQIASPAPQAAVKTPQVALKAPKAAPKPPAKVDALPSPNNGQPVSTTTDAGAATLQRLPNGEDAANGASGHPSEDVEQLIQAAELLQSPTREHIWELADNEFEFKRAKEKVFCTTFTVPQEEEVTRYSKIRTVSTDNSIMDHGDYDFERGTYKLALYWWYRFQDTMTVGDTTFPQDFNRAVISPSITIDSTTAETWRNAISQRHFTLTVWYRFTNVARKSRWTDPHSGSSLSYDVSFDVDVLRFKASTGK